jgi:octaprenyl-diphosphate synthase
MMNIIDILKTKFKKEFENLDSLIKKTTPSNIKTLDDALLYIQQFNGKRLRIILLFLFYDFFKRLFIFDKKYYSDKLFNELNILDENIIKIGLSIEFIHNATLFHDDVVDNNQEYRRGSKPANQIWHNKLCILSGDFLLAKSFEKIIEVNNYLISDILSKTSSTIIKGEVLQLFFNDFENQNIYSFENYLNVIFEKTAILFSSSIKIGLIMGFEYIKKFIYQKDFYNSIYYKNIMNAIEKFGKNFGIAFQIMDDILDYFGEQKTLGKQIGTDFFERKITLPAILLKNKITEEEWKNLWHFNFNNEKSNSSDLHQKNIYLTNFLEKLNQYDIFNESLKYVEKYILYAKEDLEIFFKEIENLNRFIFEESSEILNINEIFLLKEYLFSMLEFLVIRKT